MILRVKLVFIIFTFLESPLPAGSVFGLTEFGCLYTFPSILGFPSVLLSVLEGFFGPK